MHITKLICLSTILATLAPMQAQRRDKPSDAAASRASGTLAVFDKQSIREQKRILTAVRAAVGTIKDDYLSSLRKAAASRDLKGKKPKTRQKRNSAATAAKESGDRPFPVRSEYAFGFRTTLDIKPEKRQSRTRREAAARRAELEAMLRGYLPDLDKTLAALLRSLDHDRSADALSRLFETWRNGSESFYHALDRTAGTQDSLFFYDAMLDDFVLRCVPKKHPDYKKLRGNHNEAHDMLHRSFLAYRQYRALREAVALSLLLPQDVPLPKSLGRYERAGTGQYSIRQQVALLLRAHKQDVAAVVDAIRKTAPPLPETLWAGTYDPFPAFSALVDSKREALLSFADHTDKVLAQQDESRSNLQRRVAAIARTALRKQLGEKAD